MSLASFLRRLFVFGLAMALPAGAIGLSIGWVRGAIVAEAALVLALLLAAWRAEKGISRVYRAREELHDGATRSLERVLATFKGKGPKIRSFPDPAPQALVVRSPGSSGTILLSEGLLGLL